MNFNYNFYEHPSRKNIHVFHFSNSQWAQDFEDSLTKQDIPYEKELHKEENQSSSEVIHCYGISREHVATAKKLNFLVYAKHRKHFIADPVLRYVIIAISIGTILLGFIGYVLS